ncbi:hypothetical protein Ctob_001915 [Chrysochromulina tobinii]|jgi:hypothetical protein|uniref:Uncharacterized protein n=1 Tax=Chrysochromulina tobinii TaxID=1460289 RepID=A0A0M0JCC8_9EUKA|nr:hypothetical protein Ctob_001915 [Chrysochromulina tobinii]|eukprot:KOO24002.1 hypothetical protein Ctob_001915 [Chrysochromulina sp. CCMP291]
MVSFDLVRADVVCLQEQINLNPPPAPLLPDELAVPETPQGHAQPKGDTAGDTPEWLQEATEDLGAPASGLVFFDLAAAPTAASAPAVSGLRGVQGALASNYTGRRTSGGTSGRTSVAKPTRVPAAEGDLAM